MTDRVLLLVQRTLFNPRYMSFVLARHESLFLPDLMVLDMQCARLGAVDLTLHALGVNAGVLVREAIIDLLAPRMGLLSGRVGESLAEAVRGQRGHESVSNKADSHGPPPGCVDWLAMRFHTINQDGKL